MPVDTQLVSEGTLQLQALSESLGRLRIEVNNARDKIAGAVQGVDPCPTMFAGIIENYRFTTGKKGDMPSHRFEVICGNGLQLHVEATSAQFDAAMRDMSMGEITTAKLNKKLCVVRRESNDATKRGCMIPVRMIPAEPLKAGDKWGDLLWEGAYVRRGDNGPRYKVVCYYDAGGRDAAQLEEVGTGSGTTLYTSDLVLDLLS